MKSYWDTYPDVKSLIVELWAPDMEREDPPCTYNQIRNAIKAAYPEIPPPTDSQIYRLKKDTCLVNPGKGRSGPGRVKNLASERPDIRECARKLAAEGLSQTAIKAEISERFGIRISPWQVRTLVRSSRIDRQDACPTKATVGPASVPGDQGGMPPTQRAKTEGGLRGQRLIGFWDAHPDVRQFVAGLPRTLFATQIQELVAARFGEQLVPGASAISRLRMGLTKGRWKKSGKEPASEGVIASGAKQSPKPEEKMRLPRRCAPRNDRPAPGNDDRQSLHRTGSGDACPSKAAVGPASVPGNPPARAPRPRTSGSHRLDAGATVDDSQLPAAAAALLSYEQIECRLPGCARQSRFGCLARQAHPIYPRYRHVEWSGSAKAKNAKAINAKFSACRGCPHFLSDADYEAVMALVKRGALPRPIARPSGSGSGIRDKIPPAPL